MSIARSIAFSLFGLSILVAPVMAEPIDPTGIWLTQAGDAKVRIDRCGTTICGTIVWLKAPIDTITGKPQIDDKNPDPTKARRPIIGINLFQEMKLAGQKWSGRIYNADNGKIYASNVSLINNKSLKVEGCVLMFCGSETWTKLSDVQTAMVYQ